MNLGDLVRNNWQGLNFKKNAISLFMSAGSWVRKSYRKWLECLKVPEKNNCKEQKW